MALRLHYPINLHKWVLTAFKVFNMCELLVCSNLETLSMSQYLNVTVLDNFVSKNELCCMKTSLLDFRPGPTQSNLYSLDKRARGLKFWI